MWTGRQNTINLVAWEKKPMMQLFTPNRTVYSVDVWLETETALNK